MSMTQKSPDKVHKDIFDYAKELYRQYLSAVDRKEDIDSLYGRFNGFLHYTQYLEPEEIYSITGKTYQDLKAQGFDMDLASARKRWDSVVNPGSGENPEENLHAFEHMIKGAFSKY